MTYKDKQDKSQKDNTNSDENVVSPTQAQMDDWTQQELAEADQDDMLSKNDDTGSVFKNDTK